MSFLILLLTCVVLTVLTIYFSSYLYVYVKHENEILKVKASYILMYNELEDFQKFVTPYKQVYQGHIYNSIPWYLIWYHYVDVDSLDLPESKLSEHTLFYDMSDAYRDLKLWWSNL